MFYYPPFKQEILWCIAGVKYSRVRNMWRKRNISSISLCYFDVFRTLTRSMNGCPLTLPSSRESRTTDATLQVSVRPQGYGMNTRAHTLVDSTTLLPCQLPLFRSRALPFLVLTLRFGSTAGVGVGGTPGRLHTTDWTTTKPTTPAPSSPQHSSQPQRSGD